MSFSLIRACHSCGAPNRIPARHLSDTGHCGSCKAALSPTDEPITADRQAFESIISEARVPVLVDFWAGWCGPCRAAEPAVRALAKEVAGRGLVLKVDTEAEPELSARFQIRSIPNFIVFSGGKAVLQQPGWPGQDQMRRWFDSALTQSARV